MRICFRTKRFASKLNSRVTSISQETLLTVEGTVTATPVGHNSQPWLQPQPPPQRQPSVYPNVASVTQAIYSKRGPPPPSPPAPVAPLPPTSTHQHQMTTMSLQEIHNQPPDQSLIKNINLMNGNQQRPKSPEPSKAAKQPSFVLRATWKKFENSPTENDDHAKRRRVC